MNINATLLGQVIAFLVIVVLILSYVLGKRKTQTPKLTCFVGFLTAFIPPLAILFLMALVLKNDVEERN